MGVIKPPWISENWFTRYTFNYCDHFGNKRILVRLCKICAQEIDRIGSYRKKGQDPYDINNVLGDVANVFADVMISLRKQAKRFGIDVDNLPDVEEEEIRHEDFLVYQVVYGYGKLVEDLLIKLETLAEKKRTHLLQKFVDVLGHSRHYIVAKIARALDSKYEREDNAIMRELADSKTSALFAYVAVKRNILGSLAFARLARTREEKRVFLEFAEISHQVTECIRDEFFPEEGLAYEEYGCEEYDEVFSSVHYASKPIQH